MRNIDHDDDRVATLQLEHLRAHGSSSSTPFQSSSLIALRAAQ